MSAMQIHFSSQSLKMPFPNQTSWVQLYSSICLSRSKLGLNRETPQRQRLKRKDKTQSKLTTSHSTQSIGHQREAARTKEDAGRWTETQLYKLTHPCQPSKLQRAKHRQGDKVQMLLWESKKYWRSFPGAKPHSLLLPGSATKNSS